MLKAKDAMIEDVISVSEDTPTYEAMRVLVDKNITGLPVVSDDMILLGIVSEKDLLNLLFSSHVDAGPVSEFMTRDVVTFDADDELVDVCKCLMDNNFRRVPVVSEGKLVGLISRKDIIKFILKLRKADKAPG